MSHVANAYVKKLTTAPSGEQVTPTEKCVLWYLADSHREEEKQGAWPSIDTIAVDNNLSKRRVREILQECVRKRIVWRDVRKRQDGSITSNRYLFTVIDGEPTAEALLVEEMRRISGERGAEIANHAKRAKLSFLPQNAPVSDCELPQGETAEGRSADGEGSQFETAENRSVEGESSQDATAENRSLTLREVAVHESSGESPASLHGNLHRPSSESTKEPARPVSVEKHSGESKAQSKAQAVCSVGEIPLADALRRHLSSRTENTAREVQRIVAEAEKRKAFR